MKFEAVVESNGGDATMMSKALVMALKGEVQYRYANIPKGHITAWFPLRNKLLSSFKSQTPMTSSTCASKEIGSHCRSICTEW
jgi:hypothetical protein